VTRGRAPGGRAARKTAVPRRPRAVGGAPVGAAAQWVGASVTTTSSMLRSIASVPEAVAFAQ